MASRCASYHGEREPYGASGRIARLYTGVGVSDAAVSAEGAEPTDE